MYSHRATRCHSGSRRPLAGHISIILGRDDRRQTVTAGEAEHDKGDGRRRDVVMLLKGAFTPKAKLFFASPKTREFTHSTVRRVLAISVETLREGRGLSPCLVSVKTVIISFINHGITHH